MMYNLKIRNPDLLDTRNKGIVLRSSSKLNFKEYKLNSEIYVKSLYARGCSLWKQLPTHIQNSNSITEFNKSLTTDLLKTLRM